MQIEIESQGKKTVIAAKKGDNLLELLSVQGYRLHAPCGGKGTCKKCLVKLIYADYQIETDENNNFLACKHTVLGNLKLQLSEYIGSGITEFSLENNGQIQQNNHYYIALDIGTTTVAGYLINGTDGQIIDKTSFINPQCSYGADVISRIEYCTKNGVQYMQNCILKAVRQMAEDFKQKHNITEIYQMFVAANTTMLHIFAGVDPTSLGVIPFQPTFTCEKVFSQNDINVGVREVILLPSVSAYVGSDIAAGVIATEIHKKNTCNLLIDIGTNGEMVLSYGGKLYACSTAAGPAFEGANIECGMGGVAGAINSCRFEDNKFIVSTVSGKASGICGSGLIDIIAILLDYDMLDESGLLNDCESVQICENVHISQKDIREVQLAKSAVKSGILTLIKHAGITLLDIGTVYISGGFGFYVNLKNACKIGLIPKELESKLVQVGNSSAKGCVMCALDENMQKSISEIAENIQTVELSSSSYFMQEYVENMFF